MTDKTKTSADGLDASTRLAVDRTRLALDRTAMAWTRTAISLITFGYGVYKVIDVARPDFTARQSVIGHREFGLIMICVGLVTLMLGTYEHRRDTRQLQADYPAALTRSSGVRVLSGFVAVLGLLALLTMHFRT